MGEIVDSCADRPSHVVVPGIETIDGTRIGFIRVQHAETENALMFASDQEMLITQDLVYHRVHVFVGERPSIDGPVSLKHIGNLDYGKVHPPGHGLPGGPELYDGMLHGLSLYETNSQRREMAKI